MNLKYKIKITPNKDLYHYNQDKAMGGTLRGLSAGYENYASAHTDKRNAIRSGDLTLTRFTHWKTWVTTTQSARELDDENIVIAQGTDEYYGRIGYSSAMAIASGDDPKKSKAQSGGGGDNPRYPGVKIVNVDSDRGHFNYRDLTIYVPIGMKDDYIQHEYGHYLQLLSMPFDCYKKCETQSFISGVKDWFRTIGIGNYSHRYFWFEVDANKRAIEKFGKDSELYKNSYWPR